MITQNATATETQKTATICQSNPEPFDASGLTDSGDCQADRAAAVDGVLDAMEACTHCPLLAACRRSTQSDIDSGVAPVHVVRAGIFWGLNGRPDPTLAGALDQPSTDALAAECSAAVPETVAGTDGRRFPQTVTIPRRRNVRDDQGPISSGDDLLPVSLPDDRLLIGWDASWVHLREAATVNQRAIDLLLSDQRDDWGRVVTRLYLDQYSKSSVDGREIAEDADVCMVIREAIDRGVSRRSLCARLSLGEDKLEEIMVALGLPIVRSKMHQRCADARERNRRQIRDGLEDRVEPAEHDDSPDGDQGFLF